MQLPGKTLKKGGKGNTNVVGNLKFSMYICEL